MYIESNFWKHWTDPHNRTTAILRQCDFYKPGEPILRDIIEYGYSKMRVPTIDVYNDSTPYHPIHAVYNRNLQRVELDCHSLLPDCNLAKAVFISHELGHHIDFGRMSSADLRLNDFVYDHRDTLLINSKAKWPSLRTTLYDAEDRAWTEAFQIMKKIDFQEWEYFFKLKDWALGTYKAAYHIR